MVTTLIRFLGFCLLALILVVPAESQTRSDWEQHDGLEVTGTNPLGLIQFACDPRSQHGNICEYDDATIPPFDDSGWGPGLSALRLGQS